MKINRLLLHTLILCVPLYGVDQSDQSPAVISAAISSDTPLSQAAEHPQLLVRIQEDSIDAAHKTIAQQIYWRTWKKRAAYATMAAFVLYNMYDFYSSIVKPTVPLEDYQAAVAGAGVAPHRLTWTEWLTSGSTWKNAGLWAAGSIGSTIIGNGCYNFMSSYTEPSVIAWYVGRISPTEPLIHGMYFHAEKLAHMKVHTQHSNALQARDFYYNSLVNHHSMLIGQITKILGFMQYKAESMPAQRRGYAAALIRYSTSELNRMTGELERLIINKYGGIGRIIAEIDMEIQKMCAQFANIEGSPWADANQMQGLVLTHLLNG